MSAIFVIVMVILVLDRTNGQDISNVKQLYTDVFANHQKDVLPKVDQNTPLQISVTMYLMTITKFDEVDETIVILGAMGCSWNDAGISWDPTSYGNKIYTLLPSEKIWTPPITLINAVDVLGPVQGDTKTNAYIFYDGNVTWPVGGVMSAKCTTDISKFPYDSQTCKFQFLSWGIDEYELTLNLSSDPLGLQYFTPNSNWNLSSYDIRIFSWNGYSTLEFSITIKRASLYYSVMVVCPTILFGLLNPLVFLLPVESGERIGLAMTILLSYAIFLTLVSAAIPAASNPMCILLIIMIVTIVISGVIVVLAIYVSSLYYRDNKRKINAVWKFIGLRLTRSKTHNKITTETVSCEKPGIKCSPDVNVTWQDVSHGLDVLLLIVSYILICVLIGVYFIIVR
ncbi:neuronal acetylcholine receptor subunit alpha-3-like [Mytilus trossulus]|uniref:neuronal acetylcholine receptor subunit alpha-3-like n=1 Tax=Mytilus trossulus TaxID=6551 RepID=UPI00300796B1